MEHCSRDRRGGAETCGALDRKRCTGSGHRASIPAGLLIRLARSARIVARAWDFSASDCLARCFAMRFRLAARIFDFADFDILARCFATRFRVAARIFDFSDFDILARSFAFLFRSAARLSGIL